MMWPFKWNLSACTFTWCYLFFNILQNLEILSKFAFGYIWQWKGLILQSQSKRECPGWMMEYNDMGVLNFEFSDETLWTASFQINSLRSILTWHYLFLSKCYNKIWIFCWMLTIASFGSLMVNQYHGKLSPQVIIYVICMLIRHTRKPG